MVKAAATSNVPTRQASDVKAAGMPDTYRARWREKLAGVASPDEKAIANSRTDWDCVEDSRSARLANSEKWTVLSRRVCGV